VYRLVIFDFFDVIHSDPFKRWLRKYGYERGPGFQEASDLLDLGHISDREFYEKLSQISGQSAQSVEEVFNDTNLIDKSMVGLIKTLHADYKTGLLSNSSSEYLRPILENYDLTRLFDEIVVSAEVGLIKPSTEIFDFILERMDVKPRDSIFIDDDERNIKVAASMGIRPILFTGEADLRKEFAKLGVSL
jgi:epoxide hydrolase-like predicted phosphatase